jgi:hypothetical protein
MTTISLSNLDDKADWSQYISEIQGKYSEVYLLEGNDIIIWKNGRVIPGPGNDTISGGAGITVDYGRDADWGTRNGYTVKGVHVDLKAGYAIDPFGDKDILVNVSSVQGVFSRADTIFGTDGDDYLWTATPGDFFDGRGGVDTVWFTTSDKFSYSFSEDFSEVVISFIDSFGKSLGESRIKGIQVLGHQP